MNARTSLRLKRKSARSIFFCSHAWLTISSISKSKRRVCGGSSSSERPSTSCARRLAVAISSSVASMYSSAWPLCVDGLPWPLILVQERDGADEREVLHVIAPRARAAVEEGQLARVGIHHQHGLQEPLRVAMHAEDFFALVPGQQPFDGLRFALLSVDRLRLRAVLVHGQHQTAVEKFFVEIDRRRGEEEHHRAFDAILVRDEPSGRGVFAGDAMVSTPSDCKSFSA